MLLRRLFRFITTFTFRFVLFFTISIIAFVLLYTDSNYVKTVFEEEQVYDRVVESVLETNKDQPITADGSIRLGDPEIRTIIREIFPADQLQTITELVINNTYEWLEQDADMYAFVIDLSQNKERLADGVSAFAIRQLEGKPLCTGPISTLDPFASPCRPPNIDLAAEQAALRQQILDEGIFIDDPIITEQTVFGDESGEAVTARYSFIPTYFSLAKALPVYIAILLIALALLMVFLHGNRRMGIKRVGKILISVSLSLIIFTVIFSFVLPGFTGTLPVLQSSGQGLDSLVNDVTLRMSRDYAWMILFICAPLIAAGIALIVAARSRQAKRKYDGIGNKAGLANANKRKKTSQKTKLKSPPPVISSESSETKPKRRRKNAKYRKIPKKEL